ncbi:MAG: hypothetical protein AB8B48_04175 [Pseudomonadales bacterium]
MADSDYRVVFEGQIAEGFSIGMVKKNLAKLFKADADRIATIFSGQAVVLKRNIDHPTALKYQAVLQKAGAVTALKSATGGTEPQATQTQPQGAEILATTEQAADPIQDDWSIAPAGSELLHANERRQYEEANLDVSHISIASSFMSFDTDSNQDGDVVAPDTSHLSVAAVGETLGDGSQDEAPVVVNDLQASIAPVGAELSEHKQEHEPLELDLSHLSLSD